MKKTLCLAAALLAAMVFSVHALPSRLGKIISPARSFFFHGRWYSGGKPSKNKSLIREEFSRHGFDITRIPPEMLDSGDEGTDPLSDIPAKNRLRPIVLPSCFRAENDLTIYSGSDFIDISCGKVTTAGSSSRKEILAEGWTVVGMEEPDRPFSLATIRRGRETSFVFLEEKKGDYLFVRRLDK